MTRYLKVNTEAFFDYLEAIEDIQELHEFIIQYQKLSQDTSSNFAAKEALTDADIRALVVSRQILSLAMFCRENWELIRDLSASISYTELTQEEADEIIIEEDDDA